LEPRDQEIPRGGRDIRDVVMRSRSVQLLPRRKGGALDQDGEEGSRKGRRQRRRRKRRRSKRRRRRRRMQEEEMEKGEKCLKEEMKQRGCRQRERDIPSRFPIDISLSEIHGILYVIHKVIVFIEFQDSY